MPKLKTKSGAKKRFRFTASGKVKAGVAGKRHRLISHNAKYPAKSRHFGSVRRRCDQDQILYALRLRRDANMARVKRGVTSHAKHKKVLDLAKGYSGRRKNTIRTAKAAVDKAGQYAYRDRRVRKRMFRSLWIQRINAAARMEGFTYSQFIHGLTKAGIEMDRKAIADVAMHDFTAFKAIADKVRTALAA
jgi:large subunit ribosomal protein L20